MADTDTERISDENETGEFELLTIDHESAATGNALNSFAAVLIERNSGEVLYDQNALDALPPASTCKVLTVITAMDMADPDQICTVSAEAAAIGDSSIYLREGESLTLDELICGALIRSGNDACYAIAENVAGSESLFVHWLNIKAMVLGAYSAVYLNTNGLPADGHKISALDLAKITDYCFDSPRFEEIVSTKYMQIGEGGSVRQLKNTNKLLWADDSVDGVKTGTTDAAGSCLIASKRDGDAHYISVVLHSADRYGESLGLLNYGADNYCCIDIFDKDETVAIIPNENGDSVAVCVDEPLLALIERQRISGIYLLWNLPNQAPTKAEGTEIGSVALYYANGECIASVGLYLAS